MERWDLRELRALMAASESQQTAMVGANARAGESLPDTSSLEQTELSWRLMAAYEAGFREGAQVARKDFLRHLINLLLAFALLGLLATIVYRQETGQVHTTHATTVYPNL